MIRQPPPGACNPSNFISDFGTGEQMSPGGQEKRRSALEIAELEAHLNWVDEKLAQLRTEMMFTVCSQWATSDAIGLLRAKIDVLRARQQELVSTLEE